MSAPDTCRLQVNIKTRNGSLLNVYGDGGAELESLLHELNRLAPLILATEADILAGGGAPAPQPQAAPAAPPQQPAQQYQAPAPAPAVAHPQGGSEPVSDRYGNQYWFDHPQAPSLPDGSGKFVLKQGTSQKTGKQYKMWIDPIKAPNYPFDRNARPEFKPDNPWFNG